MKSRFVLLLHATDKTTMERPTHWDFMIEIPGTDSPSALRTWALESEPQPGAAIKAVELAPHRRDFLQYEGPVSANRGTVQRIDRGHYEILDATPGKIELRVFGAIIRGTVILEVDSAAEYLFRWVAA